MGRIKTVSRNNTIEITVKSVKNEQLDVQMADWLSRNIAADFIMPRFERKGDKFTVIYHAPGVVTLKNFLKMPIGKEVMCILLDSVVKKLSLLGNNHMQYSNVLIGLESVLVNPATKKVMFLYYPVIGYNNNIFVNLFLEEIIKIHKTPKGESNAYLSELQGLLKNPGALTWDILNQCISKMSSISNNPCNQNNMNSTFSAAMSQSALGQPVPGYTGQINRSEGKNCPTCGTSNLVNAKFCVKCGLSLNDNISQTLNYMNNYTMNPQQSYGNDYAEESDETTLLSPADDEDATTVLSQPFVEQRKYPYLILSTTQEKIIVNKDIFQIGKSQTNDFTITGNTNISRMHADIVYQNGTYYIIDKNSTNHKFVNGMMIQANVPVELTSDSTITLANEVLSYYMD